MKNNNLKDICSKKIVSYAIGTAIEGIALGFILSKQGFNPGYLFSIFLFIIGSIFAISSYNYLKRKGFISVKKKK